MRTDTIAASYIDTSYHSNPTVHHVQRYVTGAAGFHSKYLATGHAGPQLGQTTDGQMVRSPRLLASLPVQQPLEGHVLKEPHIMSRGLIP